MRWHGWPGWFAPVVLTVAMTALVAPGSGVWAGDDSAGKDIDPRDYDNTAGTSMNPILVTAIGLLKEMEAKKLEVVRLEFDVIATKKTTERMLDSGFRYAVVAFGDYRIKDIDLRVYKQSESGWIPLDEDTDTTSVAIVKVEPSSNALYRFEVSAYQYESDYTRGHYGLMVLHE